MFKSKYQKLVDDSTDEEKFAAQQLKKQKEDEKKYKTCGFKCKCKDDWNCKATDQALLELTKKK